MQASELGIRLEIVNGLPLWEAQPLYRHQKHIERIIHGISKVVMELRVAVSMRWMSMYNSPVD